MRSNSQRAKNAIIGLYVGVGAAALLLLTELYTLLVLTDSISLDMGAYDIYVGAVGFTTLINLGAFIACAIVFIQWFRRAYFNLHKLVPSSKLRFTEGWAAGAWFVPIFNLFGPFQIATDLFTHSENLLVQHNLADRKPGLLKIAGWWWGLWVAQSVLGNVSGRMMDGDIDVAAAGAVIAVLASIFKIGAGYLAIQMIKNFMPMEELLKQVPNDEGGTTVHITNDDLLDSGI